MGRGPGQTHKTHKRTAHAKGTAQLRLLATTDLHMQLIGFDYVNDCPTARHGLAGIASLIETARAEASTQNRGCLLFDNGDLLQGSALGHRLAQVPVGDDHPAAACLNQMEYDAIGVGNHDLDFGLPYLRDVAARLEAPVIATNLEGHDLAPLQKSALIKCVLPGTEGTQSRIIRVGVLSVLPMQTAIWNSDRLQDHACIDAATDCLRAAIPMLRARGADLIIVLAHMGITPEGSGTDATLCETALTLAKLPGIDAMITGHTHRRFPGQDHAQGAGVHPDTGTLIQVPAIMPGHGGSDLGVLDLTLRQNDAGQWRVIGHVSGLRPNTPRTRCHPAVVAAATPAHDALRGHLSARIGATTQDLHSYFSLVAPSPIGALCAQAGWLTACDALTGTPDADMPLLVAATAHTAGGREGPHNYLNIPTGPVLRRHLAGLNPYSNQLWTVRITGKELLTRLEHGAAVFARLHSGAPLAPLLQQEIPAFNFETIYGVQYRIDPRQPVGSRISGLSYDGITVTPTDKLLLVTDQFRAAGGGGFERLGPERLVLRREEPGEAAFAHALAETAAPPWQGNGAWQFAPCDGMRCEFSTSPMAEPYLDQISHLSPQVLGLDNAGFLRLKLSL
ncbi:MAG: 5'-nucleotidase C-terminal domain-containing protein [Sulfitobacter sp.]